jgi:hypothetical protein
MIKEDVAAPITTANVGTPALGTNMPKKKKLFSKKVVRNPAVSKSAIGKGYFPNPDGKLKSSVLGAPVGSSLNGLSESLNESLQRVKFSYSSKNSTVPNPEVMVLDPNYDGKENWKNFGNKDYILGYSLSHVSNKQEAIQNIQDITDFTTLLGSQDDKEYYDRIKQLFPEQASFIRAYKKSRIVSPKILDENDNEIPIQLSDLKSAKDNGFGF